MTVNATRPSPEELRAADVVAKVLGGERDESIHVEPWDLPPHQGRHDFWLHRGGGRIALEVTTFSDQEDRTNLMHWQKRGPSFVLAVPGLGTAWMVTVDAKFNARALTRGIAGWLTSLQAEGITSTSKWDGDKPYGHPVVAAMVSSGVVQANSVPGPPAGTVTFGYYTDMKSRPADDANTLLTHCPRCCG